jgi:hypothetical protein
LKTKTARAVEMVVGKNPEVKMFDRIKFSLNNNPKSRHNIDRYQTCLAKVQVLVLQAVKDFKQKISSWDKAFFAENLSIPTENDSQR